MLRLNSTRPIIRQTSIIAAIAVLLSFAITGTLYLTTLGLDDRFWDAMTFAIIVPWGISIPLGWYMVNQHSRLIGMTRKLKQAQHELKAVNEKLQHKANFDGLTGLANREHFIKQLGERRVLAENNVLMIVDADHFKNINDCYGHPVGDKALVLLAGVFKRSLRKQDLVGRIGGEEFGILLPDTVEAEGEIIGEMLRHEIENILFEPQSDKVHRMTVSIGLTGMSPSDERAISMRNADTALFEAKRRGRNQCVLYSSGMRSKPRPFFEATQSTDPFALRA